MSLIIVFIALFLDQNVLSVPGRNFLRANSTVILFNRDTDPTYTTPSTPRVTVFLRYQGIVHDWVETAQQTARRMNLGNADSHFHWAFRILLATSIDGPQEYDFPHVDVLVTALEFAKCKWGDTLTDGHIQTV